MPTGPRWPAEMADVATWASGATAGGTLMLAIATFVAVRASNRAARVTERALMAGIRPVLVSGRLEDPQQKVGFVDDHWVRVDGGRAVAEVTEDAVYLVISLRNVGQGLAVLDRWGFRPERLAGDVGAPSTDRFHRLTRDLYIPAGDVGFWQGAFRDTEDPEFAAARDAITERRYMTIDLLYGDHEGGQRTISRFVLLPVGEDQWLTAVSRHWNLDRSDPR
jgi:hypothetical protein